MDRLKYQEPIEKILQSFSDMVTRQGTEVEIIRDREGGHYLVMVAGWHNESRVYGSVIHIDIKDGKIWVQQDRTDTGVANELIEAGIPKSQIVLAFQSTFLRQFSDYAMG